VKYLSADEIARANRFRFETDRDHFIVARSLLRIILGRYLDVDPSEIRFAYGENGKPRLTNNLNTGHNLNFNLAHSGQYVVCGLTLDRDIGIDIELVSPDFASTEIANQFFSPAEIACLASLPFAARQQAFFDCWTRKEAFLKAKGCGLSQSLDNFDVTLGPEKEAALLRTAWDPGEADRWQLEAYAGLPNYAIAIAAPRPWRSRWWRVETSPASRISPSEPQTSKRTATDVLWAERSFSFSFAER
jgi:4'-phosphopantetheinyl transferase